MHVSQPAPERCACVFTTVIKTYMLAVCYYWPQCYNMSDAVWKQITWCASLHMVAMTFDCLAQPHTMRTRLTRYFRFSLFPCETTVCSCGFRRFTMSSSDFYSVLLSAADSSEVQWVPVSPVSHSELRWVVVSLSAFQWVPWAQWVPANSIQFQWVQVSSDENKWYQARPSETKWVQVQVSPFESSESKWDQVRPSESKIHCTRIGPNWGHVSASETWRIPKASLPPPTNLLYNFSGLARDMSNSISWIHCISCYLTNAICKINIPF